MDGSDLTICSVSFHSRKFLELNRDLTTRLNPGFSGGNWNVVENTPDGSAERFDFDDHRFAVAPGVDAPRLDDLPEKRRERWRGSYHHGAALNQCVAGVRTRFVLVLDPDFFLVRENWIGEVTAHMAENDLTFFGVPWHPRWYRKYRYFPCVHCLFIDRSRVDLRGVDFLPDLAGNPARILSDVWAKHMRLLAQKRTLEAWWEILKQPRRAVAEDWKQRKLIGTSRDTGFRLRETYARDGHHRYGVVEPVFRPEIDGFTPQPPHVSGLQTSRLVRLLVPDRFDYVPKRPDYFTGKSFRERGYVDVAYYGWEEFVWQDRPFGFHVRGFKQREQGHETLDTGPIRCVLESLTGLALKPASVLGRENGR
jgi:hypothetical protein